MLTGEILRHASLRDPDRTAIIHGDRRISYRELYARSNRFAHGLLRLGLGSGDRIAILSSNSPEYAAAYFGAASAGCVLAHASLRSTAADLTYMLGKIGAQALVFDSAGAALVAEALSGLREIRHFIFIDAQASSPSPLPHDTVLFSMLAQDQHDSAPIVELTDSEPLAITFTGGTTGFPKAVLVTHRARYATAVAAAAEFGLKEEDIVAVSTPMFHAAGLFVWFVPAIMQSATVVLQPTWDAAQFIELCERERISACFMVPTQLCELISHPMFSQERLASLRNVGYAGAPMSRALLERVREALPEAEFTENYGQSESCPLTVRRPSHEDKLETVGRPVFNVEIAIVDETGQPLPPREIGEILTRGDTLFQEYLGDPEQTAAAFLRDDGWLWTGDLGYLDDDGFLVLVDRSKDVVISGGENIYPAEIENALYRHPAVAECAVFSIPDERWGELPAAHVVLNGEASVSEAGLIAFCGEQIARHKRPRLVKFVDALPRTSVGKIQKSVIRAPYWTGRQRFGKAQRGKK